MSKIGPILPNKTPPSTAARGAAIVLLDQILQTLLLGVSLLVFGGLIIYLPRTAGNVFALVASIAILAGCIALTLMRKTRYENRALIFMLGFFLLAFLLFYLTGFGVITIPVVFALFYFGGFFLSWKGLIGIITLWAAGVGVYALLSPDALSVLQFAAPQLDTPGQWIITISTLLLTSAAIIGSQVAMASNYRRSLEQVEKTTEDLRLARESIEKQLQDRTVYYQRHLMQGRVAAEISGSISSILDQQQLLQAVVDLMQERFELYYVGVFVQDTDKKFAVLRTGTGEAGKKMLAAHHSLAIGGSSMIGWSILNRQPRIALDTGTEAIRFNNPYLPLTRSELALPIVAKGEALGALSIQSTQPNAFIDSGNARVLKFDNTGKYLRQWGQDGEPERALGYNHVSDLVTNGNGRIYALDVTASRILSFDPFGNFVTTWTSPSINQRTFVGAENLAVDPSGSVFLADTYGQTIWRFDGAGQLQSQIAAQYPQHISADADGNVYGAELRHFQLVKYDSGGVLRFSTFITHSVSSTAVNPDGGIYVSTGAEIKAYSTDGVLEGTFAAVPAYDIAMAPTGALFAISGTSVVQFDHTGAVVAQVQSEDYHANFYRVAAGSDDWLYVLDLTGRRVYAFAPGLPVPDPISGAIQNGDFSAEPALAHWRRGGTLAVARQAGVLGADGPNLRLAAPVAQVPQGEGSAWAHQTVYVEPSWTRPTLSFAYDVHTNDLRDYSDFYVEIQDAYGTTQLASVMREGYRSCVGAMPPAGTDLQWQTRVLDLSPWKGQWIRVVFWARNLWPDSLGLWADVDSVRVYDAGPAPAHSIFMPMVTRSAAGALCN